MVGEMYFTGISYSDGIANAIKTYINTTFAVSLDSVTVRQLLRRRQRRALLGSASRTTVMYEVEMSTQSAARVIQGTVGQATGCFSCLLEFALALAELAPAEFAQFDATTPGSFELSPPQVLNAARKNQFGEEAEGRARQRAESDAANKAKLGNFPSLYKPTAEERAQDSVLDADDPDAGKSAAQIQEQRELQNKGTDPFCYNGVQKAYVVYTDLGYYSLPLDASLCKMEKLR